MSMPFVTLEAEALKLFPEERVLLADRLLASVLSQSGVEQAWAAEAEQRLAEVEAGSVALIPVEHAIKRARQALS